ncbi:hypothetical protein WJX73_010413 [Symbiochloris irregularis]|uniref:Amine oxidase domain-containing protein n=1 Tax=Symbiochloris irregularis TaxID=706552 RepID=A0AAW1NXH7_9CHLO
MQEDVIIIGAGISGLAAARLLHVAGIASLSILEATDHLGGRIKQVHGMAPWPVELGPEFVHGANTSLAGILDAIGCKQQEKEWPDYFYFADDRKLLPATCQVPDVDRVVDLFESVGSVTAPDTDISARQWLMSQGASNRMLAIADASFATDFGCTLDELGLRETILEKQRWDAGFKDAKRAALSRLKMSNAIKVILAFNGPFWPEELFDVVCVDCFIPEFWVTSYPATEPSSPSSAGLRAMVGFVTGQRAVDASHLSEAEIVERTLSQLDSMFGRHQHHRPATDAFVRAHVADWSKEEYVRGCYSHPSLGALPDDRATLAASVDKRVFFAGEATHEAVNPCLQAAYETGQPHRVLSQAASLLGSQGRRLGLSVRCLATVRGSKETSSPEQPKATPRYQSTIKGGRTYREKADQKQNVGKLEPGTKSKGLTDSMNQLLYGAASRLERGVTTCMQCQGTGTCDCPDCTGRGVTKPHSSAKSSGQLFNKVKSFLGQQDLSYEAKWQVTNRCTKCRGGGRVRCSVCDGFGTRGAYD